MLNARKPRDKNKRKKGKNYFGETAERLSNKNNKEFVSSSSFSTCLFANIYNKLEPNVNGLVVRLLLVLDTIAAVNNVPK